MGSVGVGGVSWVLTEKIEKDGDIDKSSYVPTVTPKIK